MAKEREVNVIVDAKNKASSAFLEVRRDASNMGDSIKKGTQEVNKFHGALGRTEKAILSVNDKLKWMDKGFKYVAGATGAVAGAYLATTLRDFSQLEGGISKVNTLYKQTKQSQEKMVKDSISMYKLIPTDFKTITQGIYDTMSSGVDEKYATRATRKFGMASIAGETDVPTVSKAAIGTMNAYGKEVKDLDHILDVQFATVNKGIVEYDELASSLGTGVLKSAESAGIGMEELYASIAEITKNAIPASVATTSLVQLFNKFNDAKAMKNFKEFGVSVRDAKNHTRPLIDILSDLNKEFDKRGLTKEQRSTWLKGVMGTDEAVRAIQPLLSGIKDYQSIWNDMKNNKGDMSEAFGDRLSDINTQGKLIWNNLKASGVDYLYTLKPLLNEITGPIVQKQKLEFQKLDLQDEMKDEKDPVKRKMLKKQLIELDVKISKINLTPVDKFKKGLEESTKQLSTMNPLLADIVKTLGDFALSFVGDEGKGNRHKVETGAEVLGGIYAFKKVVDIFAWIGKNFGWVKNLKGDKGKNAGETLAETLRTMNVNANIVNVYGKVVNNLGGNSGSNIVKDYLMYKGVKGIAGNATRYLLDNTPRMLLPEVGRRILPKLGEGAVVTGKTALETAGLTTSALIGIAVPVAAAAAVVLYKEKKKNDEGEKVARNANKYTFLNTEGKWVPKKDLKINNSNTSIRSVKPGEKFGNPNDAFNNYNTLKGGPRYSFLVHNLLENTKKDRMIENKIQAQNNVKVSPPKVDVKVMIDGKLIPSTKSITVENIGEHVIRTAWRYGRKD